MNSGLRPTLPAFRVTFPFICRTWWVQILCRTQPI